MATLIIDRFDGKKRYEQSYTVAAKDVAGKTVLNTLLFIKQTQDPTLNLLPPVAALYAAHVA